MRLGYHGGLCCGVKTIFEMGTPGTVAVPLDEYEQADDDLSGEEISSDSPFFTGAAPSENNVERLDRYLAYLKKYRPRGIVEICLATNPRDPQDYWSQEYWFKPLKERGFKMVTEGPNSNSGNIIHIFHLVMNYNDDDWKKDEKSKEKAIDQD
jgi:hypothetical protein